MFKTTLKKISLGLLYLLVFNFLFLTEAISIGAEAKKEPSHPERFWELHFTNIKKKKVVLKCEVAETQGEQSRGLMFRNRLEKNSGMIFVYKRPRILRFWMKHTRIPLSIAFINEKNIVIDIRRMKPYDEKIVSSQVKSLYAVEANLGWFRKNYIFKGNKVQILKL